MTTKQRLKAEAAYESAVMVARDLTRRVEELLQDLPAPNDELDVGITWGHVGNVSEVNQRLAAVIAFLEGTER